jgi:raffinose/stachyose/melibiose transport system permease protein
VFEFIYIVTQGGPAYGSEVLATLAYRHAFFESDVGQAAAAASVMSLFGLCATTAYLWLQIRDSANAT